MATESSAASTFPKRSSLTVFPCHLLLLRHRLSASLGHGKSSCGILVGALQKPWRGHSLAVLINVVRCLTNATVRGIVVGGARRFLCERVERLGLSRKLDELVVINLGLLALRLRTQGEGYVPLGEFPDKTAKPIPLNRSRTR